MPCRARRVQCAGEICLACLRPIVGPGVRLVRSTLTTYTHVDCARGARALLDGTGGDPMPSPVAEPTCFRCTNPMAPNGGVSIALVSPGRRRARTRTFHKLCLVAFLFPKGRRTPVRVLREMGPARGDRVIAR